MPYQYSSKDGNPRSRGRGNALISQFCMRNTHELIYFTATRHCDIQLTVRFLQFIDGVDVDGGRGRALWWVVILRRLIHGKGYDKDTGLVGMLQLHDTVITWRSKLTVGWGRCGGRYGGFVRIQRRITWSICTASIGTSHQQEESGQGQKCSHIPDNGNDVHGGLW